MPGRLSGRGMKNRMLRSGLALAGANVWLGGGNVPPEAEGGLLTAGRTSPAWTCWTRIWSSIGVQTGLGAIQFGEGVLGLRELFILAGTRRLVMSLWRVPDAQTKELMVDFYQRILRGDGVAQALRRPTGAEKQTTRTLLLGGLCLSGRHGGLGDFSPPVTE